MVVHWNAGIGWARGGVGTQLLPIQSIDHRETLEPPLANAMNSRAYSRRIGESWTLAILSISSFLAT